MLSVPPIIDAMLARPASICRSVSRPTTRPFVQERRRPHARRGAREHVERPRLLDDRADVVERGTGRPSADAPEPREHQHLIEQRRLRRVASDRARRAASSGFVVGRRNARSRSSSRSTILRRQLAAVRQPDLDVGRLGRDFDRGLTVAAAGRSHELAHHRARVERAERQHGQARWINNRADGVDGVVRRLHFAPAHRHAHLEHDAHVDDGLLPLLDDVAGGRRDCPGRKRASQRTDDATRQAATAATRRATVCFS